MKKYLPLSVVAVVVLIGCVSMKPSVASANAAPLTVVVDAQSLLRPDDADLFIPVLADVHPNVADGKARSLRLRLDRSECRSFGEAEAEGVA